MEQEQLIPEWQADNLITEIKDLQTDKERFTLTAENKCKNIMEELENKTSKIDNEIEFKKAQLRAFFATVDKKSSKTQETYSMFSGKLVMKKPTVKIVHDDIKVLEWAQLNAKDYIEVKEVSRFDWKGYKDNLVIDNGKIFNSVTGEVLEDSGITLEEVGEQFEIK